MFEQSMLLYSAAESKARALAASLTLQTFGVAILLALPLMYTERLPFVQPSLPLVLRPVAEAPPVERPVQPDIPRERSIPRVFHAPSRIPQLSSLPSIPEDASPPYVAVSAPVPVAPQAGLLPRIDAAPPVVHPVAADSAPKRIVQSSGAQEAKLIHKVVPVYPPLAKLTRISGTVHLTGIIATDGTIRDLQVETGPPLLIQAALEAVRQWVYQPTLLSGKPVEVITSINVTFTLTQ
jgi:periplasmic protein TonB